MSSIKNMIAKHGSDMVIYACVLILVIFGIVMIGSASVGQIAVKGENFPIINVTKQIVFVVAGAIIMIVINGRLTRKQINKRFVWLIYFIGLFTMILCRFLTSTKGSYAWIRLGPITIQPAEFMKIALILLMAYYFGEVESQLQITSNMSPKQRKRMREYKRLECVIIPLSAVILAFLVGVLVQKDLGSSFIMVCVCLMIGFCAPSRYYKRTKRNIGLLLIVGSIAVIFLANFVLKSYQLGRIQSWLNPLADTQGTGMQLTNALVAFASGGIFGRGFNKSRLKYGYIPESHNDMIGAIIAEELGLVGVALFMIPTLIIIYRMFIYGTKIKDPKSKLILYGIGSYFFMHLFINLGGVTGFIPLTGVPLLFISAGGSSTVAAMIAIGIGQSIIARYNREKNKEKLMELENV